MVVLGKLGDPSFTCTQRSPCHSHVVYWETCGLATSTWPGTRLVGVGGDFLDVHQLLKVLLLIFYLSIRLTDQSAELVVFKNLLRCPPSRDPPSPTGAR